MRYTLLLLLLCPLFVLSQEAKSKVSVNTVRNSVRMGPMTGNLNLTMGVKNIIQEITSMYDYYQDFELKERTNTGVDYEIHYDLIDYVLAWCDCETALECKLVLQKLEQEKDVFLGEFVKAILKINNISCEMERIAESCGNMALLSKLKEIPLLTLKFVATNQSLYV